MPTLTATMAKKKPTQPVVEQPEMAKPPYPSRAKLAYAAILREQFDKLEALSKTTERSVSYYARRAVDILLSSGNPDLVCTASPELLSKAIAAMMEVLEND